jgi:Cu/Ag efflux protein CusF
VRLQFLSLLFVLALAACTPPSAEPEQPAAQTTEAPRIVRSNGTVVAVTPEYNAITIQHEPIPEYGMEAMAMEFTVADGSQLSGIEAGDQVVFELSGPIDISTISVSAEN